MRNRGVFIVVSSEAEGFNPVREGEKFREGVRVMFLENFHLAVLVLVLVAVPRNVDRVRSCIQNLDISNFDGMGEHSTLYSTAPHHSLVLVESCRDRFVEHFLEDGFQCRDTGRSSDDLDNIPLFHLQTCTQKQQVSGQI